MAEAKHYFEGALGAQRLRELQEREGQVEAGKKEKRLLGPGSQLGKRAAAEGTLVEEERLRRVAEIEKRMEAATTQEEIAELQRLIEED